MSNKQVTVFSPATVANVACGFDILGFALSNPGDLITARMSDNKGVRITKITGDQGRLPVDPLKNSAGISAIKLLDFLETDHGVEIEIEKRMPLGSGLGSSAASAAGSVFAVNTLLGNPLSTEELIPFAMEGERVACGAAHADNVAPALMGGFVLIRSYNPLDIISIPTSLPLQCVILKQNIEVFTKESREVLGNKVPLESLITQTGNLGGLIMGLVNNDAALLSRSLTDVIAEPMRSTFIPAFESIKKMALANGALGCSISGSGPAVFALCPNESAAHSAGNAMLKASLEAGHEAELYFSELNHQGVAVIS